MMKHLLSAFVAVTTLSAMTPAFAQDPADAGRELPAICKTQMQMGMPMKMDMTGMDQAHQDLMKGMDSSNANMMQGMTASDIDVAFVCGMIAHHQGAIDMAMAELAHGDDTWAKSMAQKVIDAQEKEIADMLDWLSKQK